LLLLVAPKIEPKKVLISNQRLPLPTKGMVMCVKPLQPENEESPINFTLSGMVTLVKPLQFRKAKSPIVVTLSGMVMLVKPLQSLNALLPIMSPPVIMTVFSEGGMEGF
jgi:hypothetical protein